jgi:hypothetical protein
MVSIVQGIFLGKSLRVRRCTHTDKHGRHSRMRCASPRTRIRKIEKPPLVQRRDWLHPTLRRMTKKMQMSLWKSFSQKKGGAFFLLSQNNDRKQSMSLSWRIGVSQWISNEEKSKRKKGWTGNGRSGGPITTCLRESGLWAGVLCV